MTYIGIDVSKETLDIASLSEDGVISHLSLKNNEQGHEQFITQLDASCHVVLEATGSYHRRLELALNVATIKVSVVNPRQAFNYAKSQNRRNKTDKVDALLLAKFGLERQPASSKPQTTLQQSVAREIAALNEDVGRLRNRLEAAQQGLAHPDLIDSLKERIAVSLKEKEKLEKRLKSDLKQTHAHDIRLLTSIPGIGLHTACLVLAELGDPLRFRSACSLVAFAGLTPLRHESGKGRKYSAISRMGSAHLRRILYMPALCAIRRNPRIKAFYDRLVERGKPKMVALVASMAKLLRIIFGVLKSNKPFQTLPT